MGADMPPPTTLPCLNNEEKLCYVTTKRAIPAGMVRRDDIADHDVRSSGRRNKLTTNLVRSNGIETKKTLIPGKLIWWFAWMSNWRIEVLLNDCFCYDFNVIILHTLC